jgi:uncharacterized membrane protein
MEKIMEKRNLKESLKNHLGSDSKAGDFFKSMKNRMGIGSPERNATDTYERGMKIVPDCIRANENEIPVKQYNIAILRNLFKFERAEGRMQITNKRVILRAAGRSVGGRTTLQHEYAINEIAGIEARNNFKFSLVYLIFALLIVNLTSSAINGRMPAFPNIFSLLPTSEESILDYFIEDNSDTRILRIMSPSHVRNAYANERAAILLKEQGPAEHAEALEALNRAITAEERADRDVQEGGIMRTRRVTTGTDWWGNPTFRNESFRDRSEEGLRAAQEQLDTAAAARKEAEENEKLLKEKLDTAAQNAENAIKRREFAVKSWIVLMTIAGILLGIGGLIPFFMLYKKFALKLFILNFSIFGWTLAFTASGFGFFNIFKVISIITMIVCIFLFCFRPNLIINIKNKNGANSSVDIRRDTIFTKNKERGTGFAEIIPTEETEGAIREIGAMIGDIQKSGDSCLEKWIK